MPELVHFSLFFKVILLDNSPKCHSSAWRKSIDVFRGKFKMNYKRLYFAFALGFAFLVSAGAANAASAFTTANVNLRTGPGTSYGRVATLAPGVRVDVLTCQSNWCRIGRQGIRGWVSANYLEYARAQRPVLIQPIIVGPRHHRVRPPYYRPHRPHRPQRPHRPRPNCKIAPGFSCR